MNFDFSEDQKMMADQIRRYLLDTCTSDRVHAVLDGAQSYDRELYLGLAEIGLLGAIIPEEHGGAGLGFLEMCLFAEELGRVIAPVPISSSIYLAAQAIMLAGTSEQQAKWLPQLAAGEAVGCFGWSEETGRVVAGKINAQVENGVLNGSKWPVADGDCADLAVVLARSGRGDSCSLYLADLAHAGVGREICETIDPTRGHARLTFKNVPVEPLGDIDMGWSLAEKIHDRAAVFLAFEQLGGATASLEMARDYALERMAFGRQIGSFQAMKHMMADMYVSSTLARSNAYYAAYAIATNANDLQVAAASARVSSTKAYQQCARDSIQVHGGIGFTWEHDCHLHYRRSNLLALTLGPQSEWEEKLIARMSATAA